MFSSFRHAIIRLICCPFPYLPSNFPILGGKALLESLITILLSIIIIGAVIAIDGKSAGNVADFLGVILITFAMRKGNPLTLIAGIPFERAIFWHKLLGCLVVIAVFVHGVRLNKLNMSGILAGAIIGIIALSYLLESFNISFNLFYYIHTILYMVLVPILIIHGAPFLGFVSIVWGADLLVRYFLQGKHAIGKIKLIGKDIFRVEVSKNYAKIYSGQYCFLMIKKINFYEYHPFTIASAPHEPNLVFYIRSLGDWTSQLRQLYLVAGQSTEETATTQIELHIEGPYGNVAIDAFNSKVYPTVVMIAGGIGITPMMSMLSHFLHLHSTKDANIADLKKLVFVWVVRDLDVAEGLYEDYFEPLLSRYGEVGENGAHYQCDSKDRVTLRLKNDTEDLKVELHMHLTAKEAKDQQRKLSEPSIWKYGRADINQIFQDIKEDRSTENNRVGVAVCGPDPMVVDVRTACLNHSSGCSCSNSTKQFDLHEECFSF